MVENDFKTAFNLLSKPVRRLVEERGFSEPTGPQEETIPKILDGKDVLLVSPTATGKTEAAFLPVLDMLIRLTPRPHGIKLLYITPLRALNRDLLERLEWWCNRLDIRLAVRHGDTESRERVRQARSSPEVLITTPETLQAILPGRIMRQHLRQVRWLVVDEVHEMADSKRGSQLSLALERLRNIVNADFQTIGLSATIGSPEKVAQFLVGSERAVEIVRVPVARIMNFNIIYPAPTSKDAELASQLFTHADVAARLRVIREMIMGHKSMLLFTNTRRISEVLTSRFKVWDVDFPVSIHHGSLAKPSRIAAERGLKDGGLKGLVCTSSLELGIDIGRVDLVIQYMSPRQVTRLIQRVGRSGHRVGRMAKGIIITMDSDDTIEAMAITRMALNEELEPVKIPPKPYDVLAHQIAGLLLKRRRIYFPEILEPFKKAYPYMELTVEDIKKVMRYMHSRFPRLAWVSFEDDLVVKPRRSESLYEYYFENLSMIPYEKQYLVIDDEESAIGVLDEAFIAEYGKPGVKFIIRGTPWKIIYLSEDKVYVKPVDDPTGAIPSWVGEEIPVPFAVAQEVGSIRNFVEEEFRGGLSAEEIAVKLANKYPIDAKSCVQAISETVEQAKLGVPVPTNKHIVVEEWEDLVIMHTHLGSLTNRALSLLIGQVLSEKTGTSLTIQHDAYRIFVKTQNAVNSAAIISLLRDLSSLSSEETTAKIKDATVKTGLFKRRIVHVARRFGALKRRVDFSRVSLTRLVTSFEGSAIFDEALKEVLSKDLDVRHLKSFLKAFRRGETRVWKAERRGAPTPVARVGLERASIKTDLIPPEKMRFILIHSAKARLLNEVRTLVCTSCWEYLEMIPVKELPTKPECPKCGSNAIGVLNESEAKAIALLDKRGEKLTAAEAKMKSKAVETAKLVGSHGKKAVIALSAKRVKPSDVEALLKKERSLSDAFFELVIEAERKVLKRRFL